MHNMSHNRSTNQTVFHVLFSPKVLDKNERKNVYRTQDRTFKVTILPFFEGNEIQEPRYSNSFIWEFVESMTKRHQLFAL